MECKQYNGRTYCEYNYGLDYHWVSNAECHEDISC